MPERSEGGNKRQASHLTFPQRPSPTWLLPQACELCQPHYGTHHRLLHARLLVLAWPPFCLSLPWPKVISHFPRPVVPALPSSFPSSSSDWLLPHIQFLHCTTGASWAVCDNAPTANTKSHLTLPYRSARHAHQGPQSFLQRAKCLVLLSSALYGPYMTAFVLKGI